MMLAKKLLSATGSSLPLLMGNKEVFSSADTAYENVGYLSATKAICVFVDADDSNKGKAVILDVSGDEVTAGTVHTFSTGNISYTDIIVLSSTKCVVCYRNASGSNYIWGKVLDISGSSITSAGLAYDLTTEGGTESCGSSLSSTLGIVAYKASADSLPHCVAFTVSGTVLTIGAVLEVYTVACSYISIDKLDTTHALITYNAAGASDRTQTSVITVTGVTCVKADTDVPSDDQLASATVTMSSTLTIILGVAVSGGKLSAVASSIASYILTSGTEVELSANSHGLIPSIIGMTATRAIGLAQDTEGTNTTLKGFIIDEDTLALEISGPTPISKYSSSYNDIVALTTTKALVVYTDTNNSNYGTAVIVNINPAY